MFGLKFLWINFPPNANFLYSELLIDKGQPCMLQGAFLGFDNVIIEVILGDEWVFLLYCLERHVQPRTVVLHDQPVILILLDSGSSSHIVYIDREILF